ncbi:MAG: sigma-70 family RNA polymerase sigma factor [Planctomycetes bacterium]|nr:sigma-70 family RNA polymerase sigma factor [Planctomycetota bacterium]
MLGSPEREAFKAYKENPTSEHLSKLLSLHQGRAFNLCFQVLRRREDAEDAAQEALIKMIGALPRITSARAFRHWLYRVCLSRSQDLKRRNHRRQMRELRYAMIKGPSDRPPEGFQDEERAFLFQALERLEDEERRLIVEHYFEKESLERIATREGVTRGTVWKKIERARHRLKQALSTAGFAAIVPDTMSFMESCQPIALTTDLVAGAVAKAAAASAMTTAIVGGTLVATKSTFVGLTAFVATLTLLVGGTAGYFVRSSEAGTASTEKIRELEKRLAEAGRRLERARTEAEPARRPPDPALAAAHARIAELESRVKTLQQAHEEALRKDRDPRDTAQGKKDSDAVRPNALPHGFNIDEMAKFFELDEGRKATLNRIYDETRNKIQQLEIESAKVETTGDSTRIEILLGDRGNQLREEWMANLPYVLMPSEIELYHKLRMEEALFDTSFGKYQRLIELRRDGAGGVVTSVVNLDESQNRNYSMLSAPDFESARRYFNDTYGHFIK